MRRSRLSQSSGIMASKGLVHLTEGPYSGASLCLATGRLLIMPEKKKNSVVELQDGTVFCQATGRRLVLPKPDETGQPLPSVQSPTAETSDAHATTSTSCEQPLSDVALFAMPNAAGSRI